MTKDEALRMALEALERLWNIIDDIDTYGDMAKADEKLYRSLVERRQRTRFEETGISTDGYTLDGGAITAIKEALAQPEQEPVACVGPWHDGRLTLIPRYSQQTFEHDQPLYTAPPQRTWVGLTKEQLATTGWSADFRAGALWAEAKLKERNS